MASQSKEQSKLIRLKDLMPSYPRKTPQLPISELRGWQYMKLKEPIVKDGVKVYWETKRLANEVEDPKVVTPNQGVVKLFNIYVVNVIKRLIDMIVAKVSCK
ncbi:hypothetical protein MtrunA17_Chr1g0160241 [Medicago truncatula]|uniref:Uncharacterized protein n=1 Tax=Medicago truncatula TaxID=3880 RepID=A0A396JI88_MEDTR|nr:hypothetical protein MtrunA17_Chr1g0160241 [Medicago truncatula]